MTLKGKPSEPSKVRRFSVAKATNPGSFCPLLLFLEDLRCFGQVSFRTTLEMQFLTSAHRKQPLFQGSALTKMSVTKKINAKLENINEENM